MKIAIPTEQGQLYGHFGHCPQVTLFTLNGLDVVEVELLDAPPHKPGVLPTWLRDKGATVVIAGSMGQHALALLAKFGIRTIVGAPKATPAELVDAYLAGTLLEGENDCHHDHHHHDHEHHCESER
ncbi:NifB/NifX family molybdenum-iron cluster-binding protein [Aeoliella mucimassa]|uniref:Dinitrogenase iron-molybdenum cofactor n=1 Tax=Aeoliella mucimassa TaxID=2527972 RepID=A0A518AW09_9BACT|nr:NifB/NifX family molybdenum-iron cluster-binding protein [Aeoliella mucimassa]QDU58925.1 Dinitrogenase iron-molybdenum cofactor [Aeoliella mucimassa]